eukprot:TRINITY_DN13977_c0_g1_i1.p1 TRINITY_DN13977_c0_g1~~TRINITY_DN13977_c0_g1_i1.p1  ORF type:complete len:187 (+),score=58.26 TRINITY_DN13977_c0_g1_i1:317-877(+)
MAADVGPATPINAVHFCALVLTLVPSDGVWGSVATAVETFSYSSDHLHAALQCYAMLDDVNEEAIGAAATAVAEHPGQRMTPALLRELCPAVDALLNRGTPASAAPTPSAAATPMARPGSAVVVHHPDDVGESAEQVAEPSGDRQAFFGVRPVTPGRPPTAGGLAEDSSSEELQEEEAPAWVLRDA